MQAQAQATPSLFPGGARSASVEPGRALSLARLVHVSG
jgi:hypothetical protein